MDLHDEFERHAHARASESGSRLRGADVRSRLEGRVTRGRRVRNVTVGVGTVAAVGVLAVGAALVPGWPDSQQPAASPPHASAASPDPSSAPSPTPTSAVEPSANADPVDPALMPPVGDAGYLTGRLRAWQADSSLTCVALAGAEPPADAAFTADHPSVPIPAWLETGRLYGWGDDALVGGYPIPLAASSQSDFETAKALIAEYSAGLADLVLTGPGGTVWGYTVSWSERNDLPNDAPGLFVELNADYDCNDGVPVEGVYEARIAYVAEDGTDKVAELDPITVVDGVPSLPELDAAGR